MIVMPSNCTGTQVGYWAARYPGLLNLLISPGGWRGPWPFLPYALDNGAYSCWQNDRPFDDDAFLAHCERARLSGQKPTWVPVPDVVCDPQATLSLWERWAPVLRRDYGWPLAFVAQDGHQFEDVPSSAEIVFLGGSTTWKRRAIRSWCTHFPRVHVGRCNYEGWLWYCHDAGAESVDGTGWFRGDKRQLAGLERFLKTAAGEVLREKQMELEGIL